MVAPYLTLAWAVWAGLVPITAFWGAALLSVLPGRSFMAFAQVRSCLAPAATRLACQLIFFSGSLVARAQKVICTPQLTYCLPRHHPTHCTLFLEKSSLTAEHGDHEQWIRGFGLYHHPCLHVVAGHVQGGRARQAAETLCHQVAHCPRGRPLRRPLLIAAVLTLVRTHLL